jgi:beta-glucuronidase
MKALSKTFMFYLSVVCALVAPFAAAQDASAQPETPAPIVITGADKRPGMSLNGDWHVIPDPYATGLFDFHKHEIKRGWFMNEKAKPGDTGPIDYDFSKSPTIKVPGDWNTQKPEFFYYEGLMWYEKDFTYEAKPHNKVFLHVGAANYKSIFWVNGKKVCEHEGGFTSFNCDVTAALEKGSNFVVAAVDNTRHEDNVPTTQTDWWNYGGLTREVKLIEVPEAYIDQYDLHLVRGPGTTLPMRLVLSKIEGWVHVSGGHAGDKVEVSIADLKSKGSGVLTEDGRAKVLMVSSNIELWSPDSPKLYHVKLNYAADTIEDEIGFRTIETKGNEILLNGKPVFLRGVCIHAEAPYRTGRAYSDKDAETLLGWAKEMGANFVRLAHYPHDETMLRAADRMGLMVWSENPVYWAVEFDKPEVYAKATQQLTEEIETSRNHASIVLWSMANETPINDARTKFISGLAAHARELDPTRLITAALLVRAEGTTKIVDDPLGKYLDVIGTNEYIGWYEQKPETADTTDWKIAYDKPLIMSEFGADAKAGLHGGPNDRWTEEYQANVFNHQLGMLNRIPQLRGMSPWVLMDFRSPRRVLPGIQDGFNRKGLVSDQGEKKKAFFVLQKAYTEKTVGKPD